MRGASTVSPAPVAPTGTPRQSSAPSAASAKALSGSRSSAERAPRDVLAQRPARGGQRARARSSSPSVAVGQEAEALDAADGLALDQRPRPRASTAASRRSPSSSRRTSRRARRSTKRWVRRSCSASDRRSSMARARSCQCAGVVAASRRGARCRSRCGYARCAPISVSMSPSVRSMRSIWRRHPVGAAGGRRRPGQMRRRAGRAGACARRP